MVPEGWSVTEVGDVARFTSGSTPSRSNPEFWGGVEPWISGKDLKKHYLFSSTERLSQAGYESAKRAPSGSSLILVRGMTLLKDFPVGYATRELAFNQDIKALIPIQNVDGLFLSFLLVGEKTKIRNLVSTAGHGTGRLDTNLIKQHPIYLPPLPEQKKIAQILSTWDKAIDTTERLLANSQQQKKALMQQLLTGKKRLLDEDGVRFSGEWGTYTIEDLEKSKFLELGRGAVISKKDIERSPGAYPIYSSSVKNNGLMGTYGKFIFDEELITWSIDGGGDFFLRPAHKYSVTNVSGFMRVDTDSVCYGFLANQLQMLHSKYKFDYQSKAHPSVIRKLYKIQLPSLEEQKVIARTLNACDQQISTSIELVEKRKQEKKALMQQLLTGKRRVKVDEAA